MLEKIDVRQIVTDHLATLRDADGRRSLGDIILHGALPLGTAALLIWRGVVISEPIGGLLINAFAIFAGLLLNLLLLVHSMIRRARSQRGNDDARVLLRGLYSNLSFGVLTCIANILLLITSGLAANEGVGVIIDYFVLALGLSFVLTLLMSVKRVHVLLRREFEN